MTPRLVFTDLDGSLLDHDTYSFEPALPVLAILLERGIPLIPVTSKTRAEVERLRQHLDNADPFIVENGAAVMIPVGYFAQQPADTEVRGSYWVHELSAPREVWQAQLQTLRSDYAGQFETFADMGPSGIAQATGLALADAELANCREYSEPLRWLGSVEDRSEFIERLRHAGATPLQGGRFLSVAGACDKGRALRWLRGAYQQALQASTVDDLAAGDSGNDVAMLEAAGTALVIRSPVHDFPVVKRDNQLMHSRAFGPAGWAEGVLEWLAIADHND